MEAGGTQLAVVLERQHLVSPRLSSHVPFALFYQNGGPFETPLCYCAATTDGNIMERVKYCEIIADNLSKSRMELGLRVSFGLRRANNLDCGRTSRRRKTFRCACG